MQSPPKLTIVVPVYNSAPFLNQALESLREQSFRDWEAILLDDGSTDNSLEILENFRSRDTRFRVIHKENSGYGATVNRGIREARGEFLAILEPDDFLLPNAYEHLLALAGTQNLDVAKGDYFFYWSDGRKIAANALRACPTGTPISAKTVPALFALPLSVWSAIYRTEFLRSREIYFLETPGASFQDNAFSFKVFALAERVALTDEKVLCYRQDNANSSIHSPKKTFCIFDEFHELDAWLAAHPRERESFAYDFWLFRYKAYFAHFLKAPADKKCEFLRRFRQEFCAAHAAGTLPERLFKRIPARLFLLLHSAFLFSLYAKFQQAKNARKLKRKFKK